MEILKAILFGIVEGITEWLPISSTGHMILLDEFVQLDVSESFLQPVSGCDPARRHSGGCPSVLERFFPVWKEKQSGTAGK